MAPLKKHTLHLENDMKSALTLSVAIAAALALPLSASAHEAGDLIVRVGAHSVSPDSDNGRLAAGALEVDVDNDIRPTVMLEYMINRSLGLEVIAALPFQHDISLNGAHAGSTRHLPPTVSLQWHFNPAGQFQPFVGAGLNYTTFFSEKSAGPIAGTDLELDDSWGLALHAGFDVKINDKWMWGADVRWIDIDTDVSVDGAGVGTVNIDPIVYGVFVGYRF